MVHRKRDFLGVARSWPKEESWGLGWVERIGELYQCNDARVEVQEKAEAFQEKDGQLRQCVAAMAAPAQQELADPQIHPARQKVLVSLQEHWSGLTVFVDQPEVPLDNKVAERVQRGPVVGRKNY